MTIGGRRHYLWRAVDKDGDVLDILVQSHRDKRAAKRFFRKLLKGLCYYAPRQIVTDKLRSYGADRKEILPDVVHDHNKRMSNRVGNSHQTTRQRERQKRPFESPEQAQLFLSAHGPITSLIRFGRHLMGSAIYHLFQCQIIDQWREVKCVQSS